jgi:hypothetical protein
VFALFFSARDQGKTFSRRPDGIAGIAPAGFRVFVHGKKLPRGIECRRYAPGENEGVTGNQKKSCFSPARIVPGMTYTKIKILLKRTN